MIRCRTSSLHLRRAFSALAVACALGGPVGAADPVPSRSYPPAYSSRKAPWYDPLRLFTDTDQKTTVAPAPPAGSKPIPNAQVDTAPATGASTPAWKWYGYGTPKPGGNLHAPANAATGLPSNWHLANGTTPGAVPVARIGGGGPGIVPDPTPGPTITRQESIFASTDGPTLVTPAPSKPDDVAVDAKWGPAPATLRSPSPERTVSTTDADGPGARLRAPVPADEGPVSAPTLRTPVPPTEPTPPPPAESPDIPVEPAPGIVVPPLKGGVSRLDRPLTARGTAPEVDIEEVIRRACGPDVRPMEITMPGTRHVVVRLAATAHSARQVGEKLAQNADLAGWRIELELVTALQR